jgi:hypothetical protein
MTIQKVTIEEFTKNFGGPHGRGKRKSPAVVALLQLEVGEAMKITTEHQHYPIKRSTTGNTMCSIYQRMIRAAKVRNMNIAARCVDGTVWVLRREDNSLVI